MVLSNMKYVNLCLSDEDLKVMKKTQLKSILKKKIYEKFLSYLLERRGTKGGEISYSKLEMSNYLMPSEYKLSNNDKKQIFSIRNKMINLHSHFPSKNLPKMCVAGCQIVKSDTHLYKCEKINLTKPELEFNNIYNGELSSQLRVFQIMKHNIGKRELLLNSPGDLCDPLTSQ